MIREDAKTKLARKLRQAMNAPEQSAWRTLRKLRKHGFAVRRQHPIGPYVVDFAIASKRLAIEIDGGVHALPEVAERDRSRVREIDELGRRIIRIKTDIALSEDHLSALIQKELGI